jgi:hypothetical protein
MSRGRAGKVMLKNAENQSPFMEILPRKNLQHARGIAGTAFLWENLFRKVFPRPFQKVLKRGRGVACSKQ